MYTEYNGQSTQAVNVTTVSAFYDNNVIFDVLSTVDESNHISEPLVIENFAPNTHSFDISQLFENGTTGNLDEYLKIDQIDGNHAEVSIDCDGGGDSFELLLILQNANTTFELDQHSFIY
mgnify:CR=1 FL=1